MTKANDRRGVGVEYDPDTDVYYAEFDSTETNASTAVVESVAEVRHCDPMDLEPLYHSVDTDALDAIIDGSEGVSVSLVANGLSVTIDCGGTLEIKPPALD